jgi:hypothetical protein
MFIISEYMNIESIQKAIRPVLTFIGFTAVTYGFIIGRVSGEIYIPIVSMMIAFWFATRKSSSSE